MEKEASIQIHTHDDLTLEGRLCRGGNGAHAVLCHPHPLYGGSMDNNVVVTARDALTELGWGTLRFNFRGVGRSEGRFSSGAGEALDVAAACAHLKDEYQATDVHVVAYSFGVWVFLSAIAKGLKVESSVLVAPPISTMDFSALSLPQEKSLIIAGAQDQHCHLSQLETWISGQKTSATTLTKTVLEDTDHFFWGRDILLKRAITDFFVR